MNKIGIFGVGCIGSVLTKYLYQKASNQIYFFNRSEKKSIQVLHNGQFSQFQIKLTKEIDVDLDWLLVCIKSYDYQIALPKIQTILKPNTKVAVFRNGINLSLEFLPIMQQDHILETIIDCSTSIDQNGNYRQLKKPQLTLPKTIIAHDFMGLFDGDQIDFNLHDQFEIAQWKKLIESSALGSIQVKSNGTCLVFKEDKNLTEYIALVEEGIAVAISHGIDIDFDFKYELLEKLSLYPPSKGSSMLSDKLSGKQLELNAKIGAIIKLGRANQVPIPITETVYQSLLNDRRSSD